MNPTNYVILQTAERPATHTTVGYETLMGILLWAKTPGGPVDWQVACCGMPRGQKGLRDWYVNLSLAAKYPQLGRPADLATRAKERLGYVEMALERLGRPDIVSISDLAHTASDGVASAFLWGPAGRRNIPALLVVLGYDPYPNPDERQGRWLVRGKQVKRYRKR